MKKLLLLFTFIVLGVGGLLLGLNLTKIQSFVQTKIQAKKNAADLAKIQKISDSVIPKDGFTLPISWGDLGPQLVKAGVVDKDAFEKAAQTTDDQKKILEKGGDIPVTISASNQQFVVDLLWAVGLAQKSLVYDEGPLTADKTQVGNYASTGGWTLAKGDATKYLNKFNLIPLNPDQQKRVEEIAKNVYRPCCDNPTWFPDCNHGMAALAAIEMMVSKNMSDENIYKNVLKLNSFWFPDSYIAVAIYFDRQGTSWDKVDAKKILGAEFSTATGASKISQEVGPFPGHITADSCGT